MWYFCFLRLYNKGTRKAEHLIRYPCAPGWGHHKHWEHTYHWPSTSSWRNWMTSPFLIRRSSGPLFLQSARALYLPGDWKVVLKNHVTNWTVKQLVLTSRSVTQRIHTLRQQKQWRLQQLRQERANTEHNVYSFHLKNSFLFAKRELHKE